MQIFSKKCLQNSWSFATINNTLNSVACSEGKYFIGGNDAKIYASGNLLNWSSRTVSGVNGENVKSIVTGRDYLIATFNQGYVSSACVYDLTSWTTYQFVSQTQNMAYTWQKVICDNTKIYAIGSLSGKTLTQPSYHLATADFVPITPVFIGGHMIQVGVNNWSETTISGIDTLYDALDFINGTGTSAGFALVRGGNMPKTSLLTIGNNGTNTLTNLYASGTTNLDFQPTGLYIENSNLYGIGKIAGYNNTNCIAKLPTQYQTIPNNTYTTGIALFKKIIKANNRYYAISEDGYIGISDNIFANDNFELYKFGNANWCDIATDNQNVVAISTNGLIAYKKV